MATGVLTSEVYGQRKPYLSVDTQYEFDRTSLCKRQFIYIVTGIIKTI